MILGSHNSWSYLKPTKWWMRPFAFMAKCQDCDIKTQYEKYNVKLFDLRVRFDKKCKVILCHGMAEYSANNLLNDLKYLNDKGDVVIRYILDLRGNCKDELDQRNCFVEFLYTMQQKYPNLRFTCGRELPSGSKIIEDLTEFNIIEKYSSVCPPKLIDDWIPYLYAKLNNKKNRDLVSDNDWLLIDFVNI